MRRLDRLVHGRAHHRVRRTRPSASSRAAARRARARSRRASRAGDRRAPRAPPRRAARRRRRAPPPRSRSAWPPPAAVRAAVQPHGSPAPARPRARARVLGDRLDALPVQRSDERADEERVAAGRGVARRDELGTGGVLKYSVTTIATPGSLSAVGRMTSAVGSETSSVRSSFSTDCSGGRRPEHDEHRQPLEAAAEEREPAERRRVAPVHVVDHDRRRPLCGDVRGQPVQPVQHAERDVAQRSPVSSSSPKIRSASPAVPGSASSRSWGESDAR